MHDPERVINRFLRFIWPGLAFLVALVFLTPLGDSVKLSSAAPGSSFEAANRARLGGSTTILKPEARRKIVEGYLQMPLIFEANQGQTDPRVKFISRGDSYALFLTDHDAVLELRQALEPPSKRQAARNQRNPNPASVKFDVLRLELTGSNQAAQAIGLGELPGKSNYYIGNNPSQWHPSIPQYSKVEYHGIYPGVNLVYYGSQGHLEYDFDVSPGVNPGIITLSIDGLNSLKDAAGKDAHGGLQVDSQGNLVMATPAGILSFRRPVVYQVSQDASGASRKNFVNARYVVKAANATGKSRVGFELQSYNKNLPLVIDPTLTYSTYIGGSLLDRAQSVALDKNGNLYVTGNTLSTDFPTTLGVFETTCNSGDTCLGNAFVMELTPSIPTSTLVYSTYLGGNGNDTGFGIAVDASGNAFVTGEATSSNFPTSPGAYQSNCGGPTNCEDAFVTELGPGFTSPLEYSTYLGGNGIDEANAIALDSTDDVYVAGLTVSTNFPVSPVAFQIKCGTDGNCNNGVSDGFFTILNFTKSPALVYSTYLGGSGEDFVDALAFDSDGDVYVTGETKSTDFPTTTGVFQTKCILDSTQTCEGDAFVSKVDPRASGSNALLYSTRLGGTGEEAGNGIAVDSSFDAYVTGFTSSTKDFPVQNPYQGSFGGGGQDAFLTKLKPDASGLIFSTYLGGNNIDNATGIMLGANDTAYVTGSSNSSNFPTQNPLYNSLGQGSPGTCSGSPCRDVIVTEFDSSGTGLLFSTYLGGSSEDEGNGIVLDSTGNAYVTGFTESTDYPTASPTARACVGTCGQGAPGDAFLSELGGLTAPFAFFSTASVDFGNQNVGSKSSQQSVNLTNTGNASLTISSVILGGANPTDFTETDNCVSSSPLAPGAGCTAQVAFDPTAVGPLSAALTVTDTAGNSPQAINLSGTSVQASISISPTSLNFSGQAPGSTSAPQTVTLTNPGSGTVTLTRVAISGPFALATGTTCASNTQLTMNQNCVMYVTFSPTSLGSQSGAITLSDNASGSPQSVPLTGKGSAAGFTVTATTTSQTVSPGSNATYQLSLTPQGGFNQAVSLTCTGQPDASTCTVNPNSVTPNSNGSVIPLTVTVVTTAASLAPPVSHLLLPPTGSGNGWVWAMGILGLLALTAFLLSRKPRRAAWILAPVMLWILMASACGSNSTSTSGGGGGGTAGTPAGTYSLKVTGTAGSVTSSVSLSLTVN